MRRGVELLDQSFGARLQVVAEDNRHEVLDDEIAVLGESFCHFRRDPLLVAPEALWLLHAGRGERVQSAQAVPCLRAPIPRWAAIVWPMSAKLPRMPTECGFNPGPE